MLAYMETSASLSSGRYVARLTALPFFRVRAWSDAGMVRDSRRGFYSHDGGCSFRTEVSKSAGGGFGTNLLFHSFRYGNFKAVWVEGDSLFYSFLFSHLWFHGEADV